MWRVRLVVACGAVGCVASEVDSDPGTLPPEDTNLPRETGDASFYVDTNIDDTGIVTEPEHLLTITHEGTWVMSPNGGPWTTMTGELRVTEILDGKDLKPACEVVWALTGQEAEEPCATCDAAFAIGFYAAEGDPEACRDPEGPVDGERWRMGWDDAGEAVWYDYLDTGIWLRWYVGSRIDDEVTFTWTTTVGVAIEEEDP